MSQRAWCKKVEAGTILESGMVSHGICKTCAELVMKEIEIYKQKKGD